MSMYDFMLEKEEYALALEVRDFVKAEVTPDFLRKMDSDEIKYPREIIQKLGQRNLLGVRFPKEYGGRGLSWTAEVAANAEIGLLGIALSCGFVMPSIVGEAINTFGTKEQKARFLTRIIKGEMISAEALTEPRGGSDFFGATSKAVLDGDHFIVNGQKRFVVGAQDADIFLVYVVTNSEPNASPYQRISSLLIERGPGVEVDYQYGLLGCRGGGTGRVVFKNCRVPKENLIGPLHGGAIVFNQMMIPERLTSSSGTLAGARGALDLALRYSDKRMAFGKKIRKFQAVSFKIADSITQLDAARSLVYNAAKAVDKKSPRARRIVSESKKFATQMAWDVCNNAMQVMGGIGYTDVYPIERMIRDIRLAMIWTGTNEIMSLMIQHEYYEEILKEKPDKFRNIELDATNFMDEQEKCYTDEDMWRGYES